ncbi:hypothetical protein TEA_021382 [Camellia sinensis var. sinensis]|uniref:MORF/ORRM1/DAG-like MORF domain-containing protein n=1 Tax=Camellia sinensis var. sinensis TaxID=542762 RepID=A0A4S4EB00_CAMSN|nr:hypothetical protein TEA_021382 [Camellia sinensis var. sinensis]
MYKYFDAYYWYNEKFTGSELFVNGEIVKRSPERQRRVEPVPQRAQDRPRYNDRTRYVRRRENMREEEAKQKIYNVSCERYFGFGCEIDEETSNKLEGLPGVLFVLPDSYVDPENKDYGDFFEMVEIFVVSDMGTFVECRSSPCKAKLASVLATAEISRCTSNG